jgi:hypothetical protein
LTVGLRTLLTESEKFNGTTDSVTLREATVGVARPGSRELIKRLVGKSEQVRFLWRAGHYEFKGTSARDPLMPTPSDGP